jgi:hypothetical protein
MQYITKLKIAAVHQLCDVHDKSTEFTLALIQDACDVDLDCAVAYFNLSDEEHLKLFKDVNALTETISKLENFIHM